MITFISKNNKNETIKSSIKTLQYPGGELSLNLDDVKNETPYYAFIAFEPENKNISEELTLLGLWIDYCHSLNVKSHVLMPYLPAARADRGTPFGGKVYANIINSLEADKIIIFDPHSPIVPKLLKNVEIVPATKTIVKLLEEETEKDYTAIIAPDNGAKHRAYQVAQALYLPLITAEKHRDFNTGRILNYDIDLTKLPKSGKLLVIDDICDGGGTFNFLAEKTQLPKERLSLWVSHGIFSGNAPNLTNSYQNIYTTNSIKPYHNIATKTVNVMEELAQYI